MHHDEAFIEAMGQPKTAEVFFQVLFCLLQDFVRAGAFFKIDAGNLTDHIVVNVRIGKAVTVVAVRRPIASGIIPPAVGDVLVNLGFSGLNYVVVANWREQSVLSLIAEQHLMVSVGSGVGAILGAWLGGQLAVRREQPA